ncbi:GGDEF domain-containing protein [Halomonas neptunia]|uniref:diguanylate cyclase n=2 Tax=Vreelandella neptunia TaxID=115551 RepID=A0ABS9SBL9_9GAMM|nr:GGDEF domain-containing protein [Halomonas neptunia]
MLTDELTGLYNRRHLVNVAFAALTQAKREKTSLSILLLDLDFFKRVNDTYGHPIGDEVLRQVSERLRQCSRPTDTLGRIGGEEFCLLMPATHTHDALQVAERLRREIESIALKGLELNATPTVSIGVTTSNGGSFTFDELYSFADKALYQAKELGRNRVESVLPPKTSNFDNIEGAYTHSVIH